MLCHSVSCLSKNSWDVNGQTHQRIPKCAHSWWQRWRSNRTVTKRRRRAARGRRSTQLFYFASNGTSLSHPFSHSLVIIFHARFTSNLYSSLSFFILYAAADCLRVNIYRSLVRHLCLWASKGPEAHFAISSPTQVCVCARGTVELSALQRHQEIDERERRRGMACERKEGRGSMTCAIVFIFHIGESWVNSTAQQWQRKQPNKASQFVFAFCLYSNSLNMAGLCRTSDACFVVRQNRKIHKRRIQA